MEARTIWFRSGWSKSDPRVRVRILRGAREVGGSCVEVEAQGKRIVLDIGLPLAAGPCDSPPLPSVEGLSQGDDSLLGIVISHAHPDHFGLLGRVAASIPFYMGEAASNILAEAAFFSPLGLGRPPAAFLRHREPFDLGPFRITPFLIDHSAFDAYSPLVEADGRRLFYTGDLRAHGRKAGTFEALLAQPPDALDVLLLEGTHVRSEGDGTERGPTENDIEEALAGTFRSTHGLVLVMFSPQNIDRLVSVYRACLRSGRDLVIDLYTDAVVRATGRATIPRAEWDRVRVYLPKSQRSRVIREKAFHRTDAVRPHRIYPQEIAERAGDLVFLFRASMSREVADMGCLKGARAVWSMWPGYLQEPSGRPLQQFLRENSVPLDVHHASGHAHVPDLQRLVSALRPGRVVPIHTSASERFEEFFPRVEQRGDGEWWDV